jgi:hypothetical protein
MRGRIYRIVYRGGVIESANNVIPCPNATAPAGEIVGTDANPPEGTRRSKQTECDVQKKASHSKNGFP